jgi:metal-responsive CopG/Arc/MetJ family transcriptional regulator
MAKLRNRIVEAGSKANMRKTTIELTEEQYFFLKEKALELQKKNRSASIVSIIRDLIEKDRQEWKKGKKKREVNHVSKEETGGK